MFWDLKIAAEKKMHKNFFPQLKMTFTIIHFEVISDDSRRYFWTNSTCKQKLFQDLKLAADIIGRNKLFSYILFYPTNINVCDYTSILD